MESNQKAIRLIDSWEPAIGIRGGVERLAKEIKKTLIVSSCKINIIK